MLLLVPVLLITAEAALLLGVVLPGASTLLTLGVLAHAGLTHPVLAAAVAAVTAMTGTQLAYLRGRRSGLPTPARLDPHRQRALRREPVALCLAQWLVGLRTLTPRLAGAAGLGYRDFTAASAPTAATWAQPGDPRLPDRSDHQPLFRWARPRDPSRTGGNPPAPVEAAPWLPPQRRRGREARFACSITGMVVSLITAAPQSMIGP